MAGGVAVAGGLVEREVGAVGDGAVADRAEHGDEVDVDVVRLAQRLLDAGDALVDEDLALLAGDCSSCSLA